MKRKFLVALMTVMCIGNAFGQVTVTENPTGTVTIAVTGEAGQIGVETTQWGNPSFDYASGITEDDKSKIKKATTIIITGNINSTDIKTLVDKNREGNTWTVDVLDMGGATIETINVSSNEWGGVASHDFLPQTYYSIDCISMTLPRVTDGRLPDNFGACLFNDRLTNVTFPDGYTYLGDNAFIGKRNLNSVKLSGSLQSIGKEAFKQTALEEITFPNTLKSIGDNAFEECRGLKTVSFPAGFEKLGNNVFFNVKLRDVYFLGKEAPTVGNNAFDEASYYGYNSVFPTNYSDEHPIGDTKHGYAERRNYENDQNSANNHAILHIRADLTDEQRAKYTDITRKYVREQIDPSNPESDYKAYYDLYYGDAMIWPGQELSQKAFDNARNGVLWDGATTYDATKYMGLHKFTIVQSDVHVSDTEKWNFGKKGQQWWTLCVPFNMTKAQVRAVFGENTNVCKLNAVVRNKELRRITLKFQNDVYKSAGADDDVVITAHVSYMIFPTVTPTVDIDFNGYNLEKGGPLPTIIDATKEGNDIESNDYTYRFIGNYSSSNTDNGEAQPIYMPKYAYFLGNKNGKHVFFYQIGDNGKWNPYSAIVQAFDGDTSSQQLFAGIDDSFIIDPGAKMNSYFGNSTEGYTTSIELPDTFGNARGAEDNIYNLHGQLVGQGSASLEKLPAGVYIKNGKKYIVR